MSISDELTRIQGAKASLKTSITNKGVEVPDTALIDAYPALVDQIETGGGGGGEERADDVLFIDYDGTILHNYTKSQFLKLTSLPENPDRTDENLTAEGWNWSLDDAQAQVNKYGRVIIGQTYHTTDGINYFYARQSSISSSITLKWEQTISNGVVVSWGDGSATETNSGTGYVTLSHTYSNADQPVITMQSVEGNTLTLGGNIQNIFSGSNFKLKKINLASGTVLGNFAFKDTGVAICNLPSGINKLENYWCGNPENAYALVIPKTFSRASGVVFGKNMRNISLPGSSYYLVGQTAYYGLYARTIVLSDFFLGTAGDNMTFQNMNISEITLPETLSEVVSCMFYGCSNLVSVKLPDTIKTIGSRAFYECLSLNYLKIPKSVTAINNEAFSITYLILDLSDATAVPTLTGGLFYKSIEEGKEPTILVPSALLSDFQSATNWSTYANFMKGV